MNILARVFCLLITALVSSAAESTDWKPLFNGRNLDGWHINDFAGAGEVKVENGKLVIESGVALTGLKRTNDLLRSNYEVAVKAMKVEGSDFFCGLTFPVKDEHATLIVGGWGGALVGVSSIDGMDASENESAAYMRFEKGQWYDIKLRVTDRRIQAWVDKEKLVDVSIEDRRVGMRPGEIEDSAPFGIATYQTSAAIQEVKIRPTPKKIPRIVFIAGKKSHGPGEHDYEKCLTLLQKLVDNSVDFVDSQLFREGWPFDEESLYDADCIVYFSDGADHGEENHPLLINSRRLKVLEEQIERGAGFVALHYTLFVPTEGAGEKFLDWIGGYFDYQSGTAENKWHSKIETREFDLLPASPEHPISKGLKPFSIREEFYYKMRFPENKKNVTPIVSFDPEKKDWEKVVGWAIERPGGGRGFGYTGGHFYKNFEQPEVQTLLLNAILWTAKAEKQQRLSASE